MPRKYYSKLTKLNSLIKEELDKLMIDEIFDSKIETSYQEIDDDFNGFETKTYRFKTNSDEQYDLNFFFNSITVKTKILNGGILLNLIQTHGEGFVPTVDIGFTLTSRIVDSPDIDDELYNANTNKNESIELMGRISFLINVFVSSNRNINIFVVGKNTEEKKLLIYNKVFSNIFGNEFIATEGISTGYNEGAFYFINKSILK